MSNYAHETVPTQFVETQGIRYAYRRFGKAGTVPLLHLGYFNSNTLKEIKHPTLIVHGNKDIVVMPVNALILAERLPNATLIVYSDSSHGAQYQHADLFLGHVRLFLNEEAQMLGRAEQKT
jgi:pimeloyl-ACP methyl ester carboxylesterase